MRSNYKKVFWLGFVLCGIALAQEPLPAMHPANVAGNWTISSRGFDGRVETKTITLNQAGNKITGHFKGPFQSGSLQGTVNAHRIFFRTNTREVLRFRGQIEGDTIQGTYTIRGRSAEWHAWRTAE